MKKIITIIGVSLAFVSCTEKEAPVIPSNINDSQKVIFQKALNELKNIGYYSEELEDVNVVLVTREDLETSCETLDLTNGCATKKNIFIVDEPIVDFSYMLVHELFHIALYELTGDADKGHETTIFPEKVIKVWNAIR